MSKINLFGLLKLVLINSVLLIVSSGDISAQSTPESHRYVPFETEDAVNIEDRVRGRYIVNTDWGDPGIMEPINDTTNKFGSSITGIFPKKPWWDNAAYGKIDLEYEIVTVDGMSYMQMTSKKLSPTSRVLGQVRVDDISDATEKSMYKLDVLIKGPPGAVYRYRFGDKRVEGTFPGGFGWKHIKQNFILPPGKKGFMLVFPASIDSGVYGIKHVKIEQIPLSKIGQATREFYEDDYPDNLLRTTAFPLGRPSSMSFRGGEIMQSMFWAHSAPDPDERSGPSGVPTFKIWHDLEDQERFGSWFRGRFLPGVEMFSPPFRVPLGGEPHVFSVYLKGKGTVEAEVQQNWVAKSKRSKVVLDDSGEWQRLVIPWQPQVMAHPPYSVRFYINMEKGDNIWFDAMQVERGTEPTSYKLSGEAEVQLAVEQYDTRIQFTDDADEIHWAVTGNYDGAQLHINVEDVYGDKWSLKPIPLEGDAKMKSGVARFAKTKDIRPHNIYRIEAYIKRDDKRISTFDERTIARLMKPRYYGKRHPDSRFGVHISKMKYQGEQAKYLGFNWIRNWQESTWASFERTQGVFGNEFLKEYTEWCINEIGLDQLPILIGTPKWARKKNLDIFRGGEPKDGMFGEYVKQMTSWYEEHFPGYLTSVEVWNEPYHPEVYFKYEGEERSIENTTKTVVRLHKEAYEAVKSVNPNIEVLGIAGTLNPAYRDYMEAFLESDAMNYMDAISYHNYTFMKGTPDSYIFEQKKALFEDVIMPNTGKPPVLDMTEGSGIPRMVGHGLIKHALQWTPTEQDWIPICDKLHRYYIASFMTGTRRTYFYLMGSYAHTYGNDLRGFRSLNDEFLNLHPTAAAHAACAWYLEDTVAEKVVEVKPGLWAFYFTDPTNDRVLCVLMPDPAQPLVPDTLDFNKPIEVVDLFGNPIRGEEMGETVVYLNWKGGDLGSLEAAVMESMDGNVQAPTKP